MFFGLSGTGKTTLSADPERSLTATTSTAGAATASSSFEGAACYAKTIRLSSMVRASTSSRRRSDSGRSSRTSSWTRDAGARPRLRPDHREHPRRLPRLHRQRRPDGHRRPAEERRRRRPPTRSGVLPHHQADHDQAAYHFHQRLYREARGDGGRGQEPMATFSACFGPLMPRHPGEVRRCSSSGWRRMTSRFCRS